MKATGFAKGCGISKWKEVCLVFNPEEMTVLAFKDESCSGAPMMATTVFGWSLNGPLEKKECPKHVESGFSLVNHQGMLVSGKARNKDNLEVSLAFADASTCAAWSDAVGRAIQERGPAVFGVPLITVCHKPGGNTVRVPWVVRRLVEFLRAHDALTGNGLFRVSAGQGEVTRLKEAFDSSQEAVEAILAKTSDYNVASHVIKLFFRELPEPLLTYAQFSAFVKDSEDAESLRAAVLLLPKEHKYTLQFLIQFLTEVAAHSSVNKMDARNLAIVFGPTILRAPPSSALSSRPSPSSRSARPSSPTTTSSSRASRTRPSATKRPPPPRPRPPTAGPSLASPPFQPSPPRPLLVVLLVRLPLRWARAHTPSLCRSRSRATSAAPPSTRRRRPRRPRGRCRRRPAASRRPPSRRTRRWPATRP